MWCHKAGNWIWQDQMTLTYANFLAKCKFIMSRCKQYQKATLPSQEVQLLLHPSIKIPSGCKQANAASMNTYIPGANVRPTVRNAITVDAMDISLASTENHACNTEVTSTQKITDVPRRTRDGLEIIIADTSPQLQVQQQRQGRIQQGKLE